MSKLGYPVDDKAVMQTYSGGPFSILHPRAEDVRLLDIAESLSKIGRWTGHSTFHLSVAQHSVVVSMLLEGTGYELDGLMHDAHEYITGDIGSPLKVALRHVCEGFDPIKALAEPIQKVIAERFGLRYPTPDAVKSADMEALMIERKSALHPPSGVPWHVWKCPEPRNDQAMLVPMTPDQARDSFIQTFNNLMARERKVAQ